MATLIDQSIALAERVLNDWKGTPEELGATLHDATMTLHHTGLTPTQREEYRQKKYAARAQIAHCDGGLELIHIEERLMRGEK